MIDVHTPIQIAVFDFDNTLYQTEKLKAKFYSMAEIHGYTREEAKDIYNEARVASERIIINLSSYLTVLREQLAADHIPYLREEVSEIIEKVNLGNGLLPYAKEILTHCKKKGCDMYLLSLGVKEWQEEKVAQAKIGGFFEDGHIIYTDKIDGGKVGVLHDILGKDHTGDHVAIFNDKPDETRNILEAFPDMIAFVRREPLDDRYSELNFELLERDYPGRVVWSTDLKELRRLIQLV